MNRNCLILILIVLILNGCNNEPKTIHGLELQGSFCPENVEINFPDKKIFINNKNEFRIDFPKHWLPEEDVYSPVHGVVAGDTILDINEFIIVGVTEFETEYTDLKVYFENEILSTQEDPKFQAYEIGKSKINEVETYWVLYEMRADTLGDHRGLIHYIQKDKSNIFYLIETTVYGLEDYKEKICKSMEIVNTFRIIKTGV